MHWYKVTYRLRLHPAGWIDHWTLIRADDPDEALAKVKALPNRTADFTNVTVEESNGPGY